jgi:hypothetical protein
VNWKATMPATAIAASTRRMIGARALLIGSAFRGKRGNSPSRP